MYTVTMIFRYLNSFSSYSFSLHSLNVCSGTRLRRTFFSSAPIFETKDTLETMDKKDVFYQ